MGICWFLMVSSGPKMTRLVCFWLKWFVHGTNWSCTGKDTGPNDGYWSPKEPFWFAASWNSPSRASNSLVMESTGPRRNPGLPLVEMVTTGHLLVLWWVLLAVERSPIVLRWPLLVLNWVLMVSAEKIYGVQLKNFFFTFYVIMVFN